MVQTISSQTVSPNESFLSIVSVRYLIPNDEKDYMETNVKKWGHDCDRPDGVVHRSSELVYERNKRSLDLRAREVLECYEESLVAWFWWNHGAQNEKKKV